MGRAGRAGRTALTVDPEDTSVRITLTESLLETKQVDDAQRVAYRLFLAILGAALVVGILLAAGFGLALLLAVRVLGMVVIVGAVLGAIVSAFRRN